MYTNVWFSVAKFLAIPLFIVAGLIGAAYGYMLLYFISLGAALVFFIKVYPRGVGKGRFETKKFVQMSGGMFLATLFSNMVNPLLLMLIGLFSSSDQVAFMEISINVGILISFIAVALSTSLIPTITELKKKVTLETIGRISRYMILSTIPLAVLAISLRTSLVRFVYGSNYMAATSTMGWTSVGFCIFGCFMSFYSVAQAMGRWKDLAVGYIISCLSVLVFGTLLVPVEGSIGAAKVFVVSVLLGTIYLVIKFRGIGYPIDTFSKAIVASGAMLIPILAIWNWTFGIYKLLVGGLLGLATYLLVIFAVKGLDREDVRLLKRFFTKVGERI
jgi:O-antigen/teichoic acid export membrane protein